ncbi:transglycosylase SLT domain-containing protein [Alteromonas sp. ASW11-19]|uniref:Transglycosylase SLT domain-containing protein n=1 Tax=Alteromonas salexigens TaxID=2982530 RepID=A0ABT2VU56_9ALTE|nr:transglycosylase SLT domain-containing protein [Alteromonas salexigens]MCU7555389.1 transglycosylase SLT domain-containing protein [Alteromonas salexigens]
MKPRIWAATLAVVSYVATAPANARQQPEDAEFERFQQQLSSEFAEYERQQKAMYDEFVEEWQRAQQAYKKELSAIWGEAELSDSKRYVSYSQDLRQKTVVDYQQNTVSIEVQGQLDEVDLLQRIEARLAELATTPVQQAVKEDPIVQRLPESLHLSGGTNTDATLLDPDTEVLSIVRDVTPSIKATPTTTSMTVTLPSVAAQKRVTRVLPTVKSYAQKHGLSVPLMLAIIHTESSFNPMARSHIPAFGLMQIVPTTAGRDVSEYLYGEQQLFSPAYLFEAERNIEAGSVYFYLLSRRYFGGVKNDGVRQWLAIAAYNTGPGNVARTFGHGFSLAQATHVANTMSSAEVHRHLMSSLPAQETKDYLTKISERQSYYQQLLETL